MRSWRDSRTSCASSARGSRFAGLSAWRVLLLLLCVAGLAAGALATEYVWIGDDDDYYHTAANWSPDTGWPNCCDDAAVVMDVDAQDDTWVRLTTSGLSGVGVEQITVKEKENGGHAGQTVVFHHEAGTNPVLRCEVYVVDAVYASKPVTASVSGDVMVQTVPTCTCSIGG
ncbi:MAG: hypothetical protein IT164_16745 [Bryobacterales bacterium]|nr:hypothetical protein [Bryobacterales bacterium]